MMRGSMDYERMLRAYMADVIASEGDALIDPPYSKGFMETELNDDERAKLRKIAAELKDAYRQLRSKAK